MIYHGRYFHSTRVKPLIENMIMVLRATIPGLWDPCETQLSFHLSTFKSSFIWQECMILVLILFSISCLSLMMKRILVGALLIRNRNAYPLWFKQEVGSWCLIAHGVVEDREGLLVPARLGVKCGWEHMRMPSSKTWDRGEKVILERRWFLQDLGFWQDDELNPPTYPLNQGTLERTYSNAFLGSQGLTSF